MPAGAAEDLLDATPTEVDPPGDLVCGEALPREPDHFRPATLVEVVPARDVDVAVAVPLDLAQEIRREDLLGVDVLHPTLATRAKSLSGTTALCRPRMCSPSNSTRPV